MVFADFWWFESANVDTAEASEAKAEAKKARDDAEAGEGTAGWGG